MPRAVQYRLTTRGVGNRCRLDVVRKGRQLAVDVALRAAPQAGKDDVRNLSGEHPFDGARVANILPGSPMSWGSRSRTASSSCRCGRTRRRPASASSRAT